MYLYLEKCAENDMVPVKSHIYLNIFNTEFIIDFHVPKKYRCEKSMEHETQIKQTQTKSQEHCKKCSMGIRKIKPKHEKKEKMIENQQAKYRPSFVKIYIIFPNMSTSERFNFFSKEKIERLQLD